MERYQEAKRFFRRKFEEIQSELEKHYEKYKDIYIVKFGASMFLINKMRKIMSLSTTYWSKQIDDKNKNRKNFKLNLNIDQKFILNIIFKFYIVISWNKAHGLVPTETPSDVDEDEEELIELELLELEEPNERKISIRWRKRTESTERKNSIKPQLHVFVQSCLITINFIKSAASFNVYRKLCWLISKTHTIL